MKTDFDLWRSRYIKPKGKLYWFDNGKKVYIEDMTTDHIINCIMSAQSRGKTKIYHVTQGNTMIAKVFHEFDKELERRGVIVHPLGFAV